MRAGFNAADLANLQKTVQNWLGAVEVATAQAAVGIAHHAFEEILKTGPQYSGDFVANTRVSMTGKPDTTFVANPLEFAADAKHRGHPEAMEKARANAKWTTPKLGTPVIISSTARHTDDYSHKIENGKIQFRPVNEGSDYIYHKARDSAKREYAHINKSKLAQLRSKAK